MQLLIPHLPQIRKLLFTYNFAARTCTSLSRCAILLNDVASAFSTVAFASPKIVTINSLMLNYTNFPLDIHVRLGRCCSVNLLHLFCFTPQQGRSEHILDCVILVNFEIPNVPKVEQAQQAHDD